MKETVQSCFLLLKQDLVSDLSSELSFKFKQAVLALMMTPAEYDADQLIKAIRVSLTNSQYVLPVVMKLHIGIIITFISNK